MLTSDVQWGVNFTPVAQLWSWNVPRCSGLKSTPRRGVTLTDAVITRVATFNAENLDKFGKIRDMFHTHKHSCLWHALTNTHTHTQQSNATTLILFLNYCETGFNLFIITIFSLLWKTMCTDLWVGKQIESCTDSVRNKAFQSSIQEDSGGKPSNYNQNFLLSICVWNDTVGQ